MSFNPLMGVFGRRNAVILVHKVVLGATGALASQDAPADSGVIVGARISAGRYKATLPGPFRVFHGGYGVLLGPDTAALTAAKGIVCIVRANAVDGSNVTPVDGSFLVQWVRPDTYVDADVQDSASFWLFIAASR